MRAHARRPLGILASIAGLVGFTSASFAAEPAAPAEGTVALRFATVTARLTPARVDPGGECLLRMALVPAGGFVWHEAPFMPSRVDVYPPAGWEAEPAEFALPQAARERTFTIAITAGPSAEGRRKLDFEIRYGVIGADPETADAGKVYFEDVRLEVELPPPELAPAMEVSLRGSPGTPGTLVMRPAPRTPREAEPRGGSPILPALFFVAASLLVLAGVAMAVRRARRGARAGLKTPADG